MDDKLKVLTSIISVLMLTSITTVYADPDVELDCSDSNSLSSAEMSSCAELGANQKDIELETYETNLLKIYDFAIPSQIDKKTRDYFIKEIDSWRIYRAHRCAHMQSLDRGAASHHAATAACVEAMIVERSRELKELIRIWSKEFSYPQKSSTISINENISKSIVVKPSLDCELTGLNICSNDNGRLAHADVTLASIYKNVRRVLSSGYFEKIQKNQIRWVKKRNSCQNDEKCIQSKYNNRIAYLKWVLAEEVKKSAR
ncbi:MAG: hypothetical protein COA42_14510 [Alteromonadaceae bacterium]|nr:MAG: hypothetical protein COA42_14510 [Alteromonadaceae bacterium]